MLARCSSNPPGPGGYDTPSPVMIAEMGARELLDVTPEQEMAGKVAEIDFATAVSALTILRYRCTLRTRL